MKLKIERKFVDKNTKAIYAAGDVIEFTDDRAAEILADGRKLASVAEDDTKATEEKPAKKRAAKKPAKKSKE